MAAALQYIGAASLTYAAFKLFNYASFYLLPPASLARYRRQQNAAWALITGASAARPWIQCRASGSLVACRVGRAVALIKAESRTVEIRIIVLDVITATPQEIEAAFEFISTLPITVSVNSIGSQRYVTCPSARPRTWIAR
ncbi:hypothetical protein F4819DRAFT_484573 [Hypoxylon fuscum]|nr:hypothetical protein F4819DRAFT_484573 [Hypoxylon fuscum]